MQDPELWFRSGNCFVHLYGQGQSQRGPAFKVALGALLSANCYPFVRRFMARDRHGTPGCCTDRSDDLKGWIDLNTNERIELYIPAPTLANSELAFSYHITTRNFLAWVFGRSVVGKSLGVALIDLFTSMTKFREKNQDSISDLVSYLDEEGYLDMKGHPNHALAILNLAEHLQIEALYLDAFVHCVEMSERLFLSPEYQV